MTGKKVVKKPLRLKKNVQKQKQTQSVVVNIMHPKSKAKSIAKKTTIKEQPKTLAPFPMMPSFNINQPTPSTDLAKLLGLLIPKLQTESSLGSSIPKPIQVPIVEEKQQFPGFTNHNKYESLLDQALNNKIEESVTSASAAAEPVRLYISGEEVPEENLQIEELPSESQGERRKYDKSKTDINKQSLLAELLDIITPSYSDEEITNIMSEYQDRSQKDIKDRIASEKQLRRK